MLRIRRKFAFILSGGSILLFLILYVVLNYFVLERTANPDLSYLENKIKQLESGLSKHRQEFGNIRKEIDTFRGAVLARRRTPRINIKKLLSLDEGSEIYNAPLTMLNAPLTITFLFSQEQPPPWLIA